MFLEWMNCTPRQCIAKNANTTLMKKYHVEFRKGPIPHTGYSGTSIWSHPEAMMTQNYREGWDEVYLDIDDDEDTFIFKDVRSITRYKTSATRHYDYKHNGNWRVRSWKRSKIEKQWMKKLKRKH